MDSWWPGFKQYLLTRQNTSWTALSTSHQFHTHLSNFLFDLSHAKQQFNFKFDGPLVCGEPVSPTVLHFVVDTFVLLPALHLH